MGDAPDLAISLAAGLEPSKDPCGDNPFRREDLRRQLWAKATRKAEEELCGFLADFLKRNNTIPRCGNFGEQFLELWIESFTGPFDIWAQRAVCVVRGNAAIEEYDRWISSYLVAILAVARDRCPELYPRDRLITELQYQLLPRLHYWKAAARRHSREIEAQPTGKDDGQGIHQAGAVTPPVSAGSQSAPPTAPLKRPFHEENPRPKKRDLKYAAVDAALRQIAEARPRSHEEVFRSLEGRTCIPNAEPFLSARGWLAGFKRNKPTARAWLSRAWYRLNLPPFPRGPKQ